jgi:hypothetical protein
MMKAMLLKNPISTKDSFRAGGSGIPILTRNPAQSTAGFQTFGLPSGKSTGGSANKTTLGAIRMGDQDGIAPGSAIFPGDIFYPPGQPGRQYQSVTFESVGNNAYQPETVQRAAATEILLRRLGDNQFKAIDSAPFEDYFATQRLAKEVNDASRNAGLEDLGHSREIMRSLVAERRKTSEDDFLRRMLDAGMTQQDAQAEVDNVRRANALMESRKVDDRTHQSKLLIQRIAKSRGILSSVNEPLTTTGAIENPQPNEKMADMTGQPENAYGSSPLDRDRQFMTPDFYRRMLRRSALTQEAGDEMAALATATAQATGNVPTPSMLRGLERENAIERTRDAVAARLDAVTQRKRVMLPLPPIAEPFTDLLRVAYRGKAPGSMARFKDEEVQDLSAFHSFVALNQAIALEPAKLRALKGLLLPETLTGGGRDGNEARRDIRQFLRKITLEIVGTAEFSIPFASEGRALDDASILRVLERIRGYDRAEIRAVETQMRGYGALLEEAYAGLPAGAELPAPIDARGEGRRRADEERAARPVVEAPAVLVGGGGAAAPDLAGGGLTKAQIQAMTSAAIRVRLGELGLSTGGNKAKLVDRLFAAQ